jgi:molybdopterin molybdotransferase
MTDDAVALSWTGARAAAYAVGADHRRPAVELPLADCDGTTLAQPLRTLTDLPPFATSSIDGWAVRGSEPWRVVGRSLAGSIAAPLAEDGTCVEIATGAMVPVGTEAILRIEDSTTTDGLVTGTPRPEAEWRKPGDEAWQGEELLAAGRPVTPGVIGLAAATGYDTLTVIPRVTAEMIVFGDELLTAGLPGGGRVRDSLGPQVPGWLRRLGCDVRAVHGPVEDTLDGHIAALRASIESGVDLIVTTGGTMHGPVDHLHPTLASVGARYVVNTVEVRPGFPMLLAAVTRTDGGLTLIAGLPGNPQSAIVALSSLVAPALDGLRGRPLPALPTIELSAAIGGRGDFTHLALVRRRADGTAAPVEHVGSAMLRGLAQAIGFAVIAPGTKGEPGDRVPLVPLPIVADETS